MTAIRDPDALIAGIWQGAIGWNDGRGTFTRSDQRCRYSERHGLAIGDFNGAGRPDLDQVKEIRQRYQQLNGRIYQFDEVLYRPLQAIWQLEERQLANIERFCFWHKRRGRPAVKCQSWYLPEPQVPRAVIETFMERSNRLHATPRDQAERLVAELEAASEAGSRGQPERDEPIQLEIGDTIYYGLHRLFPNSPIDFQSLRSILIFTLIK